jgi:bifunctional UDP-N-acetylglucosamine pyrophosphorylase/glucosamine-1-phosphate N-acetyltransferase
MLAANSVREPKHPDSMTAQDAVIAVVLAGGKGTRMKSELPKVLHTLHGRSLVQHVVERVRRVGIRDIIVVVGYQHEQVMAHLGSSVSYAVQPQQLGTAHAVMMARPQLAGYAGRVLVVYGDMPLINPKTMQMLIDRCQGDVKASILTIILANPPDFGRVVRESDGRVQRIVEVRDADPTTLAIREINVGMYCFDNQALLAALDCLSNDNAQGEYYLTDAIGLIAGAGGRIETIVAPTLEETLGINEPEHLRFAESLQHLDYAERMYPIVDAAPAISRQNRPRGEAP